MNKKISVLIPVVLAVAGLASGLAVKYYLDQDTGPASAPQAQSADTPYTAALNQPRYAFSLPDLENKIHAIKEWDGKVILLNFWATWCPPCRREIPSFIQLQQQYGAQGLQVIGVAIDQKEAVSDYSDGMGINYPVLVGDETALQASSAYGNRFGQLPYSVLIDRKGIVRYIRRGEFTLQDAESRIKDLL
jgi:thiol-disulfide isomerase/thioredoxin